MIRIDDGGYPVTIGSGLLGELPLPKGRKFLVTDANVARAGWPGRLGRGFRRDPCPASPARRHKISPSWSG